MFTRNSCLFIIAVMGSAPMAQADVDTEAQYSWLSLGERVRHDDGSSSQVSLVEDRSRLVGPGGIWGTLKYDVNLASTATGSTTDLSVNMSITSSVLLTGDIIEPLPTGNILNAGPGEQRISASAQVADTFVVTGPWDAGTPVFLPVSLNLIANTASTLPEVTIPEGEGDECPCEITYARISSSLFVNGAPSIHLRYNAFKQDVSDQFILNTTIGAELDYTMLLDGSAETRAYIGATNSSPMNTSSAAGALSLTLGDAARIPVKWKDHVSGSYQSGDRWDTGVVPAVDDVAVFDQPGVNVDVDFTAGAQVHRAKILGGNFEFLLGGHTYTLDDIAVLQIGGEDEDASLTVGGGTISVDPSDGGRVEVGLTGSGIVELKLADTAKLRTAELMIAEAGNAQQVENFSANKALVVGEGIDAVQTIVSQRLEVRDGGTITTGQGIIGHADVLLTDTGTRWRIVGLPGTNNSISVTEGILIAANGDGGPGGNRFQVLDGAEINVNHLEVGSLSDTTGSVEIRGKGNDDTSAQVTVNLNTVIGSDGTGTVLVESGGRLAAENEILVGEESNGTGTLIVRGEGSRVTGEALGIAVGVHGDGTLRVEDSGYVNAGILKFGSDDGGEGEGVITGLDTFVQSLEVSVGSATGTGHVEVTNEAVLNTTFLAIGGSVSKPSKLEVTQSGTVTIELGIDVEPGGTLVLASGGTVTAQGGTVQAGGVITGDDGTFASLEESGLLLNFGLITPGASPGTLTIDTNFRQEETGVTVLEIAGLADGQHDVLKITGDAIFGGTVVLEFINGFAPQAGQEFDLIQVDGTFDDSQVEYVVENLERGFVFNRARENGAITLTAMNDGVFVPEPSAIAIIAAGMLAMARRRR